MFVALPFTVAADMYTAAASEGADAACGHVFILGVPPDARSLLLLHLICFVYLLSAEMNAQEKSRRAALRQLHGFWRTSLCTDEPAWG